MGPQLFKSKEKATLHHPKKEEDLLQRVAATDVWKLNPDATAKFVNDLISLLLTVPFSRDLHLRIPAQLPDRVKYILETTTTKVTELEVKFNSLIPSVDLYYHLGCASYNLARYPEAENYFDKATKVMPKHFKAGLALALTKMELNKDLEALETMKRLIENEPNNEAGWYTLGLILYKLKRHEEEIESYDRAIAINRKYEPAWNNRGLTLYELGRYGEAAENFAEALKINPKNEKFWHGHGLVYMKLNNLDTALKDFETAIQVNPNYPEAWYSKAAVLFHLNKPSEALTAVEHALSLKKDFKDALLLKGKLLEKIGNYGEAIAIFDALISESPKKPEPYLAKAELMERLDNTKEALGALDKAISISQSNEAYLLKAKILKKHGNIEDALRVYLQLLEKDRANYTVMRLAGECLYELGRYEEASELFKKVLSVQVNSHEAWFWKGKCDIKRNAVKDGIHAMEMAVSLSPKNVKYIRELIRVAKELRNRDLYLKYEEILTNIEQDNPEVWYEKASAQFEIGKLSEAENAVRKALSLKKDYGEALFLLAKIMEMKEDYSGAIDAIETLLEIDNRNHEAWLFMAMLKNELEEPDEALICAQRALELKQTAEGYFQQGLALKGLGRYAEAGNSFTRAFELDNRYVRAIVARAEVLEALKSYESAFESYALAYQREHSARILGKLMELGEKIGRIDETIGYIEEGIKKDEKNPELWLSYGRMLAKKGELEKSIRALEKGLMLAPDKVEILRALLEGYTEAGRYEEAVKIGLKIVEKEESGEIWYSIGELMVKLGKLERALECYSQALVLEPEMVKAYIARGKIFEGLGEIEKAVEEYKKAVEIKQDAYEPRFALACLYTSQRKYDEALREIENALEIRKSVEAFLEKARILGAMGKLEESVRCYEEAFQISQQLPDILYEKALVLEKLGLIEPAIETLQKNLVLHKHEKSALALIELLERAGRVEEALAVCERAFESYEPELFMVPRERLLQKLGRIEELIAHYDKLLEKGRDPEILYLKAELLWKLGRYNEGRECIEEALNLQKKPEYFILYARITADAGSIDGALSVLTKGLRAFKNNSQINAEKARLLIAAGRYREAEEIAQALVGQEPENTGFLNILAMARLSSGNFGEAISLLEKILQLKPDDNETLRNLGDAYFKSHRYEEALKCYTRALELNDAGEVREKAARTALLLGRHDEALKHMEILVRQFPDNPGYLVIQGEALLGLKRYIYALEIYNRALKLQPDNLEAWYGRALALARIGDVGEALASIERVIATKKTREALRLNVKLLGELGRYEEALAGCEELLASQYEEEIALEKGIILGKMGRKNEAEEVFLEILALNERNSSAHYNLGKIYVGMGRRTEAKEHLERAIELEPENAEARMMLAHLYLTSGDRDSLVKAGEQYEAILRNQPRNREILYHLAEIHMCLENYEKAIDFINAFLAEEPNSTKGLHLKGRILARQEKWREGCRTFEKLLKIEEIAEAHLDYAECLMRLGKLEEARSHILRYIEIKGRESSAILALAKCNELDRKYEEAVRNYTEALSIEFSPDGVEGKIRVLKETGNYRELFEFYKEVIEKQDTEGVRIAALEALARFGSADEIKAFLTASLAKYPDSLQLLVRKGEFEEEWGEKENAVNTYRKALEVSITEPELWYRCARLYREFGRLASAAECLDKAIELQPVNPVYLEEKGKLAYAMLEVDLAVRNLDAALERNEDRRECWISLGTIMHEIGRYAEALKCFERAIEIEEDASIWTLKGRTLLRLGKVEESLSCFQKALSLDKTAIEPKYFIGSVLARKKDPNAEKILEGLEGADLEIQLGNLLFKKGKYEEAIWRYESATKLERTKIEAWNNLGVAFAMHRMFDEAIDAFDEAIDIEKEYGCAWYNKGIALLKIGSWKEALNALTIAENHEGFRPEIETAEGIALLELQQYENAIKLLDEVVTKTDDVKALYNLALAYLHIKIPEKALEYARRCYEKEKSDEAKYLLLYTLYLTNEKECMEFLKTCTPPSFSFWQFYLLKGFFEIKHGEFGAAIRSLDKAVSSQKSADVWLLRAYAYLLDGKYSDGRRSADAALAQGAKNYYGYTLRGLADYFAGNYEQARKLLELAAREESNALTNYNLAAVYLKTGRAEDALKKLKEALRYEPDNEKFRFYSLLTLAEIERRKAEESGELLALESKDSVLDKHDLSITLLLDQKKGFELTVKNEMFRAVEPFRLGISGMLSSSEIEIPRLSSKEEVKFSLPYKFNEEEEFHVIPGIDVSITARLYSRHGKVSCEVTLKNLKPYSLEKVKVRALEGLGYVALAEEKIVEKLEPFEEKRVNFMMVPLEFKQQFENWKEKYGIELKPEIPLPVVKIPLPGVLIPEFRLEEDYEYTKYRDAKLRRILKTMEIKSRAIEEMLKAPVLAEPAISGTALIDELELTEIKRR